MVYRWFIIACFLTAGACASAPHANTTYFVDADPALVKHPNNIARKGDIVVSAVQTTQGGAILNKDVAFSTKLAAGNVKRGERLFRSGVGENRLPLYCTVRKTARAFLTPDDKLSTCFRDENKDGYFDYVSLLDFRSELAFGSGYVRHESKIEPVNYVQIKDQTQYPTQKVGLQYNGISVPIHNLLDGTQLKFQQVVLIDDHWENVGDVLWVDIRQNETTRIHKFGAIIEIRRLKDNKLNYHEVKPVPRQLQTQSTINVVNVGISY